MSNGKMMVGLSEVSKENEREILMEITFRHFNANLKKVKKNFSGYFEI